MPQWGIMMVALNRATKAKMLVSLTGNRWAHEISILDEQLQVTRLREVEFILSRIRRY